MLETVVLHLVVIPLDEVEKPQLCLQKAAVSGLVGLRPDEHDLQRRDDEHGVGQG